MHRTDFGFPEPTSHGYGCDLNEIFGVSPNDVDTQDSIRSCFVNDLDQSFSLVANPRGRVVIEGQFADFNFQVTTRRLPFREAYLSNGRYSKNRAGENAEVNRLLVSL